ncbi:MAG: hypothetical protein EBR30_00115 [Cytophagia bacterium]|jgi:hypothetical protein|nr:hypothetical protein [Cytophagia bacterium]
MPVFNINDLSKPTTSSREADTGNPYSFQEWKSRHTNIDSNAQVEQYNTYLKNWYKANAAKPSANIEYVKRLYINFLKQLGLTTRTTEEQQFFSTIDYNSNLDLQAAIVYYARKLKDVSRYLAERRGNVVYSKLKYNLQGTSGYLERLFYNYILSVYTQRSDSNNTGLIVTEGDLIPYLPKLSDISDSFSIEIEELYDTKNYFDRDPSLDISNYTTFSNGISANLYKTSFYEVPSEYLLGLIIQALSEANTLNPCYGVTGFVGTTVNNTNMAESNVYIYTGDGVSTTFTLKGITQTAPSKYRVSIDGVLQTPGTGYSISVQNASITFTGVPPADTEVVIIAP